MLNVLNQIRMPNLSINDAIWWQYIIGIMDLRNVFSLFGIWIFMP